MANELHSLIILLFDILDWLLLARVLLSWFPMNPGDALFEVYSFVYEITEPLCLPFRKLIPPIGMFDLSIIFVFIALNIFRQVIFSSLGLI
jgi:YggT family protein